VNRKNRIKPFSLHPAQCGKYARKRKKEEKKQKEKDKMSAKRNKTSISK
jgi:hypothetical protein